MTEVVQSVSHDTKNGGCVREADEPSFFGEKHDGTIHTELQRTAQQKLLLARKVGPSVVALLLLLPNKVTEIF